MFLRRYSRYLAGEERAQQEQAERHAGTLSGVTVENKELPQLLAEVEADQERLQMDAFHMYLCVVIVTGPLKRPWLHACCAVSSIPLRTRSSLQGSVWGLRGVGRVLAGDHRLGVMLRRCGQHQRAAQFVVDALVAYPVMWCAWLELCALVTQNNIAVSLSLYPALLFEVSPAKTESRYTVHHLPLFQLCRAL